MVWTGVEDSSICLILGHSLPEGQRLVASFSTLECADLPKSQKISCFPGQRTLTKYREVRAGTIPGHCNA